ncbi:MAG: hypothetical protein TEF_16080 [Rhizobiales bacterium NRL2]|nr:MAG: hypothetical protein TEF_16080 [Rhizobiales bacterium NRL2]
MANGDPFVDPATPRMSAVLGQLEELDLSPTRRRDLRSAIRSLCRLIGKTPEEVPANINWVHVRLRRVHPVSAGISDKRVKNIKADVIKALGLCGCSRERSDWLRQPSPHWQVLLDRIPDKHDRWKLMQLAQYCTALGVAPGEVDNEHPAGLLAVLETETFVDKPAGKVGAAVGVWNRLRETIEGWPARVLVAPRKKEPWTIPLATFPESFQADVERWIERLARPCLLDEDGPVKPLRPSTIRHRRFQIQEIASALVLSGREMSSIDSLAALVDLDAFKTGLRFMIGRFGDKPTEAIHGLAMGMKAIATHHVRVDDGHLKEMRRICQRLNLQVEGLREKNRRRLEQLDDDINLARLLHLPAQLLKEASKPGLRDHRRALLLQAAVAIEILLYAPLRIGNLSALSLERHIRFVTTRRQRCTTISIPAHEVKNGKDLNHELSPESTKLLKLYLDEARPVLLQEPSDYLFPAQNGGPRVAASLSNLIKTTIREFTGMVIHAHLFRSIAGKIHSTVQPGDFVTLSHVISDSLKTAMKSYAQFEQKAALRHYQGSVDAARRRYRPEDVHHG